MLAKDLKRPADVNVSKTERLTNVALAQRQVNGLTRFGRKPAAKPVIDFKKQMRDAFPSAAKTEVGEVVVCRRLIGGDLAAEQNSEAWMVSIMMSSFRRGKAYARTTERQRAE